MISQPSLAWRLILDRMAIPEMLPVLSTCRAMNQLYSEEDWFRFNHPPEKFSPTLEMSFKRHYLTTIRAELSLKLDLIRKSFQDGHLSKLNWSEYSLTSLYQLYLASVKMVVAEQQAQQQRIMNQLQGELGELLQRNPRHANEMTRLLELLPNPDPIKIMNELHRLMDSDSSTQPIANQLNLLSTQCIIC